MRRVEEMVHLATMFAAVYIAASLMGCSRSGESTATHTDGQQIARMATEWYKSHFKNISLSKPIAIGYNIEITGEKAYQRDASGSYRFEVLISSSNETIMVCGVCPFGVGMEHRDAIREFAVRADCKMRESIATLYLDAKGDLRCRAVMPFDALLVDPDEAMWLMVGSVEEKLSGCEKAARLVCNGNTTLSTTISEIGDGVALLGNCPCHRKWVDIYKGLPPVEDVVKRWFDEEQGYYEMHHAGSDTRFSGVWRYEDGDAMGYSVEVGHQILSSSCRNPINFLNENRRDEEMCEFISSFNERSNDVSIIMDFDKGEMFFRHSIPVSVLRLPRTKERLKKNLSDITGVICDAYWRTKKDVGLIIGAR